MNSTIYVRRVTVHSWFVRTTHWINIIALLVMVPSGWRIYNASPLFSFRFPDELTLGNWLASALQWHYAMMWLLIANNLVYVILGIATGHFRRTLLPITKGQLHKDCKKLLAFRLKHEPGAYNAIQRLAYLSAIFLIGLLIASGFAIWKPVQLQELTWLMGGYEGARIVHFFAMLLLIAFLIIHLAMVLIAPKTFLSMLTGTIMIKSKRGHVSRYAEIPSTDAGDAL